MEKPEIIQMHLDILYKSVPFLERQTIEDKIDFYKDSKEKKKREEQERLQMQIQMKKTRGRQSAKKDDDINMSPTQNHKVMSSAAKKENERDLSNDQMTVSNFQDILGGDPKLGGSGSIAEPIHHNNLDERFKSKFEEKSPKKSARIITSGPDAENSHLNIKNSDNESSCISSNSQESKGRETKKGKKAKKAGNLRRILRRLKKQQRQSKLVDKIFVSQKEVRPKVMPVTDPYAIKPKLMNPQINLLDQNQKKVQFEAQEDAKKRVGVKKQIKKRPLGKTAPAPKPSDIEMQHSADQSGPKIIYTNNGGNTTNNIETNNNFFNQVYNFRCSNVEHVVQNIYITVDDNGVPTKPSSYQPFHQAADHTVHDFPMEATQQFQNDFVIQNPAIETDHQRRVSRGRAVKVHPNLTAASYQSPDARVPYFQNGDSHQRSVSGSSRRNRSHSQKNAPRGMYSTGNFFNQTMTQIVQGKQREMQPLIRKRKMHHPDFTETINFGQFAPQHQMYSFGNPQLRHCRTAKQPLYGEPHFTRMNCPTPETQQSTPFLAHDSKFNPFARTQQDFDNSYQFRMETP